MVKCSSDGEVKLCKIQEIDSVFKVVRSLSIKNDGSWTLCIHDTKIINPATLPIFTNFPLTLNEELAQDLLNVISKAKICPAHPDEHFIQFIESCKEKQLYSSSNTVLAYLDSFAPVQHKDKLYYKTERSKGCQMLVSSGKCLSCAKVRLSIRRWYQHWKTRQGTTPIDIPTPAAITNLRYINTPLTRQHKKNVRKQVISAQKKQ